MKNLYRVTFAVKYSHVGDEMSETVKVVANGDACKAVAKGKKYILGFEFWDNGKLCKAQTAKLESVECLHQIDVL